MIKEADIIYLHWICGGYQNLENVKSILATGKPVYWFCHDMFPITGGCHHAYDCDGYKINAKEGTLHCMKCQFFAKKTEQRKAQSQFQRKRKMVQSSKNLRYVTPSTWLTKCARESAILSNRRVHCIKNPIDTKRFVHVDGEVCKEILGIKEDAKVIAFGAYGALTNAYKGFDYFSEALKILRGIYVGEIAVLLFGAPYSKQISERIPYESIFTGKLTDDISLVTIYNAADVYVIPSLAENLSNTTVESMCCGTPVAGFEIGGLTDLIREETGVLCEYKNAESLAYGIREILNNGKETYNCREYITEICSMEKVAEEHIKMWEEDGIKTDIYKYR